MAQVEIPSKEHLAEWAEFVANLPPYIRAVAERVNPFTLYRMKSTGQRVLVHSYQETQPPTITVAILGQYNLQLHDAAVFGIDPYDLEECDLPGPGEAVGNAMTQQDVADNIDAMRVMIRPDLWVMGKDGKAVRRQ